LITRRSQTIRAGPRAVARLRLSWRSRDRQDDAGRRLRRGPASPGV